MSMPQPHHSKYATEHIETPTTYVLICHKSSTWLKMLFLVNLHVQVIDAYSPTLQHFHWTASGPKLCSFRDLSSALEDLHVHT